MAPAAREPRSAERASGLRAHARRFVVCAGVVAGALHANAASAQAAPGASACRPPDTSLRIELRPAVEVERSGVTLGDVASLDGPASLTRRLAALPLGPAPRAGEIVRVEREDVARWVRARTGLDGARITWSGAAAVSVRRAMRAVAGATLARHAEDGLRSALERDRLRVELSANPVPRGVNVPAGRMEIEASAGASRRRAVEAPDRLDGRLGGRQLRARDRRRVRRPRLRPRAGRDGGPAGRTAARNLEPRRPRGRMERAVRRARRQRKQRRGPAAATPARPGGCRHPRPRGSRAARGAGRLGDAAVPPRGSSRSRAAWRCCRTGCPGRGCG